MEGVSSLDKAVILHNIIVFVYYFIHLACLQLPTNQRS